MMLARTSLAPGSLIDDDTGGGLDVSACGFRRLLFPVSLWLRGHMDGNFIQLRRASNLSRSDWIVPL